MYRDNPAGVLDILAGSSAGIAGAGGIGSNAAMLLARAGLGRLVVVDHDAVEEANLNRQAYARDQIGMPKVEALRANILRSGAHTVVESVRMRLVPGECCRPFEGVDLLMEALDDAESKVMLLEEWLSGMPGTPVVAVSGIAGWGGSDSMKVRRLRGLSVVGDGSSDLAMGTISTRVALAAALAANEAVALLIERKAEGRGRER